MSADRSTSLVVEGRKVIDGQSLDHYYCCDPDVALCDLDISALDVNDIDEDNLCVVCDDLQEEPCRDPNCPDNSP